MSYVNASMIGAWEMNGEGVNEIYLFEPHHHLISWILSMRDARLVLVECGVALSIGYSVCK